MIHKLLNKPKLLIFICSLLVLVSVYIFEYIFGYKPCELCLYQRIPWFILLFTSLIFMFVSYTSLFIYFSIVIVASSVLLSGFHSGVEYEFWAGFSSCSSTVELAKTGTLLFEALQNEVAPSCLKSSWEIWGLSLAGLNFIYSFIVLIVLIVIKRLKLYDS